MKKNEYLLYILDLMEPHGPITSKALFGGYGIYYGPTIIGIILERQLYFKMDDTSRGDFEAYSSQQFIYAGKTKSVAMPYMQLPESILENSELLPEWIEKAYHVSLRHRKAKSQKKRTQLT